MADAQASTTAMPVSVQALDASRAALFARTSRLVGWGSGSVFDYFHELYPVALDYLIDNDHTRHGQRRRGVEIVSPNALSGEDPASIFVIIYSSAWPDIQQQLARLGGFRSLPASAVFADAAVRARLVQSELIAAAPRVRRRLTSRNAVVVQGPVVPAITARVLQVMTGLHPHDRIILSTWQDTDAGLLDEVGAIADDVVTSTRPQPAGIQNRNCQIVSTAAGIRCAIDGGARTILKTRTDLALLTPRLFERARWSLDRLDHGAARANGLRERLIVPASYTRKFLLFHPSDLVMLGAAEDMARYWSAPLDPRAGSHLPLDSIDLPLSVLNAVGDPAESYLGVQFCRSLGRTVRRTVRDSWRFYRDLFTVVDNDWFDLLWFKHLSIPDAATRHGVRQTVSREFWQRLYAGDSSVEQELADVDLASLTLRAMAGAA